MLSGGIGRGMPVKKRLAKQEVMTGMHAAGQFADWKSFAFRQGLWGHPCGDIGLLDG